MNLDKLTTVLIVEAIEPALESFGKIGYDVTVRVPENGPLDFVILSAKSGELMLQTRKSLLEDLPVVAKLSPASLLYADVASLDEAERALESARVLVKRRTTFYGALETWVELEQGVILGLSQPSNR